MKRDQSLFLHSNQCHKNLTFLVTVRSQEVYILENELNSGRIKPPTPLDELRDKARGMIGELVGVPGCWFIDEEVDGTEVAVPFEMVIISYLSP